MSTGFNRGTFQRRTGKWWAPPRKRDWLLFVCVLLAPFLAIYFADWTEQRAFNAMTPAEHLEASRVALGQKEFDDGLRHVSAIPAGVPEASEARRVKEELEAAKEAAPQEAADRRLAAQLAEEARKVGVRNLHDNLKNLGYDLTVAQSDNPDEITITSKDFDDTDHRVRFLSLLRGRNSPAAEVCLAGFQTVHLRTPGSFSRFFGFSQTYSLECSTWR